MRIAALLAVLALTGCAAFGTDTSLEGRSARFAELAPHAGLTCTQDEIASATRCETDPMSAQWLCAQFVRSASGCLLTLADRRVMIVPRDDHTGQVDPDVLAHERCHARGGSERECGRLVYRSLPARAF